MRKVIVSTLVSLDGVCGDPQSWASEYFDEQAATAALAVLLASDAMLMGRGTYEYLAPAWSAATGPYLARISEMRKYVFSATLTVADWHNSVILGGDPVPAVARLKEEGDGHLVVYGYTRLAQTLLENGLADELNVAVHPVILGRGATMSRPGKRAGLRLASVTERSSGVVALSYTRA